MQYFNQHSFTISSLVILILAIIFLNRFVEKSYAYLGVFLLLAALTIVWFFFRPISSKHDDLTAFQSQIGSGTPVLLEFQSPY
jgi:uncharacterized membrane protein YqjE